MATATHLGELDPSLASALSQPPHHALVYAVYCPHFTETETSSQDSSVSVTQLASGQTDHCKSLCSVATLQSSLWVRPL